MFCDQDGSMIDVFRCADIGSPPRAQGAESAAQFELIALFLD